MKDPLRLYLTRAGKNGEDEDYAIENNRAIIGFMDVPALDGSRDRESVLKLVQESYPEIKPRAQLNFASQLTAFALDMQVADLVVLPRKRTSQIAIGQVTGPYQYIEVNSKYRHTRPINWIQTEIPRTAFQQDLLYSFGAFLTVCNISRNNALERVWTIANSRLDPGLAAASAGTGENLEINNQIDQVPDLTQMAHDQILSHIQSRFAGHGLARLVDAVLQAEGWVTKISSPGPDGGVDILAGRGSLGFEDPRLCVQVKSQSNPADVSVYRALQGSMQTFNANQGLLVCWGGFNRVVHQESKQGYFTVRLWDSSDLVDSIYHNFRNLPAEVQAELPLKLIWILVTDDSD